MNKKKGTEYGYLTGKSASFILRAPVQLRWEPKQDITTFELAQCLPILLAGHSVHIYPGDARLEEEFMRHFQVI